MKLCGRCQQTDVAGGHLFLFGYGAVCYDCYQKGNEPRKSRPKVAKNRIVRPETALSAFGVTP